MICRFDETNLIRGACKSTLDRTKEHTVNEGFRKSRTVHGDKFFLLPGAILMDALGKDFLSRPRFPFNGGCSCPEAPFSGQGEGFPEERLKTR